MTTPTDAGREYGRDPDRGTIHGQLPVTLRGKGRDVCHTQGVTFTALMAGLLWYLNPDAVPDEVVQFARAFGTARSFGSDGSE